MCPTSVEQGQATAYTRWIRYGRESWRREGVSETMVRKVVVEGGGEWNNGTGGRGGEGTAELNNVTRGSYGGGRG